MLDDARKVQRMKMSWYGRHPLLSKDLVRRFASAAACKECIYYLRILDITRSYQVFPTSCRCRRCGIQRWEVQNAMILALCPPFIENSSSQEESAETGVSPGSN